MNTHTGYKDSTPDKYGTKTVTREGITPSLHLIGDSKTVVGNQELPGALNATYTYGEHELTRTGISYAIHLLGTPYFTDDSGNEIEFSTHKGVNSGDYENQDGVIVDTRDGFSYPIHQVGHFYYGDDTTDSEGNFIRVHKGHTQDDDWLNGFKTMFRLGISFPVVNSGENFMMTWNGVQFGVGVDFDRVFEPRIYPKYYHPAIYNGQKRNSQPLIKEEKDS